MTKIIELIYSEENKGKGTKDDVVRKVIQLWTKEGVLIAEHDPCGTGTTHLEQLQQLGE